MIKKTCMTMALLTVLTCSAHANIIWNFSAPGGFYWAADWDSPAVGFLGASGSATFQFLLAPDGVADGSGVGGTPTGDDIILGSWTLTAGGTPVDNPAGGRSGANIDSFGWFSLNEYDNLSAFDAGSTHDAIVTGGSGVPQVYGRIFQDSSIGVGDYYYTGELSTANTIDPTDPLAPAPSNYTLNRTSSTENPVGGPLGTFGANQIDGGFSGQVVPEPGTWALFAMGILTLAGSRLRSRK